MPIDRRRHTLTETDELARALDDAARRWPQHRESPETLLLHVIREGHRVIAEDAHRVADRRAAIERTSGALSGAYPRRYLDDLRSDWPS